MTVSQEDKLVVFAHRGFSSEVPDDTIAGFSLAASEGYGVDADVWPTAKDSKGNFDIVASHDNNLLKVAGIDKKITDMTAEEVSSVRITNGSNVELYADEHIPSVAEVLDIASEYNSNLLIEMKGKGWSEEQCEKLLSYLVKYDVLDRVIINSLFIGNLRLFRACAEEYGKIPDTLYTILYYEDFDKKLTVAKQSDISMISMRSSIIQEYADTILPAVKASGLELLTWTAGEEDEAEAVKHMLEFGIHYIAVDSIDALPAAGIDHID